MTITAEENSVLNNFLKKAKEFNDAFNRLTSLSTSITPTNRDEYDSLMKTGQYIKATISTITKTVDEITGFFSSIFQLNGAEKVASFINKPSGLGVVPLIPIAAIAGAIAYMGSWIAKVYLFERNVVQTNKLLAQNIAPADIQKILSTQNSGGSIFSGILNNLGKFALPLSLVAAYFVLKPLLKPSLRSKT